MRDQSFAILGCPSAADQLSSATSCGPERRGNDGGVDPFDGATLGEGCFREDWAFGIGAGGLEDQRRGSGGPTDGAAAPTPACAELPPRGSSGEEPGVTIAEGTFALKRERIGDAGIDFGAVGVGEEWVLSTDCGEDALGDAGDEDGVVANASGRTGRSADVDAADQPFLIANDSRSEGPTDRGEADAR